MNYSLKLSILENDFLVFHIPIPKNFPFEFITRNRAKIPPTARALYAIITQIIEASVLRKIIKESRRIFVCKV